jgi:alpha-L-fucosidase
MAGTSGAAGKGGAGGSAGTGGTSGSAGTGGSPTESNLSKGKPATADSEQTSTPHHAADGNDGDNTTRWCAADSKSNHYWEVDLGSNFTLRSLHILWEKDASYLFKVESSPDHSSWSIALDKTASSASVADQKYSLPAGTTGRYVRITVTGGLSATIWASFFELEVFGD